MGVLVTPLVCDIAADSTEPAGRRAGDAALPLPTEVLIGVVLTATVADPRLPTAPPDWTHDLVERALLAGEDVADGLRIALDVGGLLPPPGEGQTAQRWAVLAALARVNVTIARITEAHTDALAILTEAGLSTPSGTWGVFAAESPDQRLEAHASDTGVVLHGSKPWCSLAGQLDRALVTAHVPGGRQLFDIDLREPGVTVEPDERWVARGLRTVTSAAIHCDAVPARPIGDVNWYLSRRGFSWGGMGVAACWYGGALGLLDAMTVAVARSARPDPLRYFQLGTVDEALHAARCVLTDAAQQIDEGRADDRAGELLAERVRATVARAAEHTLQYAGHALGPAPLAFDPAHAARVADLELYIRQHHAERDLARLGELSVGIDQNGTS